MFLSAESRLLLQKGEFFGAGFFELPNAPMIRRHARALRRHMENMALPSYRPGRAFYPALDDKLYGRAAIRFDYSRSIAVDFKRLEAELTGGGVPADRILAELRDITFNPIARRYSVGGDGWCHSSLDYRALLAEGLAGRGKKIKDGDDDFTLACRETFDALETLRNRIVVHLSEQNAPSELIETFRAGIETGARDFREALAAFNFFYYLDECDSVGAFDAIILPYWRNEPDTRERLSELWENCSARDAWHILLGGRGRYTELTRLCVESSAKFYRPNMGIRIADDMPDTLWKSVLDNFAAGVPNPALYNETAYLNAVREELPEIAEEDAQNFCFGGCTELMFEGCSNVGSIEAGVNMLDVLQHAVREHLPDAANFDDFLQRFLHDAECRIAEMFVCCDQHQRHQALFRPQMVRTLLVGDCLERELEFNNGGARYNGGVINFAGLPDTFNALWAVRAVMAGELPFDKMELLRALECDFGGCETLRRALLALPKTGENHTELDAFASRLTRDWFKRVRRHRFVRGNGFAIPSVIMFNTYVPHGRYVGATPDGRRAGTPVADACGCGATGTRKELTALLNSAAALPQNLGLGTMVLNVRLDGSILRNNMERAKVRALFEGYFRQGGLQIQCTTASPERLRRAIECPAEAEDLFIRIGGYSVKFNTLDDALKRSVLDRMVQRG